MPEADPASGSFPEFPDGVAEISHSDGVLFCMMTVQRKVAERKGEKGHGTGLYYTERT
jgi:hypothetical protein|nr:MAG TPA: hypothetical protein [Caudoviricetes sp.]